MNTTISEPNLISAAVEKEAALAEFLAAVRATARESEEAAAEAKPALARIATGGARRDNAQALSIRALGHREFGYDYMNSAFEQAGDFEAQWFHGALPDLRKRLHEALDFAKAGDSRDPRSSGERRVPQLLMSLFSGAPVDLQEALQGLDSERARIVLGIISDYLAGRFDFTDDESVRSHFALPE